MPRQVVRDQLVKWEATAEGNRPFATANRRSPRTEARLPAAWHAATDETAYHVAGAATATRKANAHRRLDEFVGEVTATLRAPSRVHGRCSPRCIGSPDPT